MKMSKLNKICNERARLLVKKHTGHSTKNDLSRLDVLNKKIEKILPCVSQEERLAVEKILQYAQKEDKNER